MKEYEPHPLSEIFPLMPPGDIKELADDIKERGLQNPITLYQRKVLDGRHRQEACSVAGVKPRYNEYKGTDPLGFVIAANLKRRHLTTSQKAMVAAGIENLSHGGDRKGAQDQDANLQIPRANVAEVLAVSPRSVATASKIIDESPRLAAKVRDGEITVHAAAQQLAAPKPKAKEKESRLDAVGRPLPEDIVELWDRAAEVAGKLRSCASEIKCTVERGLKDKDLIFAEITNPTIAEAASLHYTLSQIAPHALCPACQGRARKNCSLCRHRGFISKYLYQSPAVSKETRDIIEKARK